jgi:hypothetical protein
VRRILERIAGCEPGKRRQALTEFTILAGLRNLGHAIGRETEKMPILNDIMDHDLLGPIMKSGLAAGKAEGERTILLSQIRKRFGSVPGWAAQRVESLDAAGLEALGLRLLDNVTLEELLG